MRFFFKTWLTICLFMPLAAHATNREQHLPAGFSGYTARSHSEATQQTRPAAVQAPSSRHGRVVQNPTNAKNSRHNADHQTLAVANKQSNVVIKRALQAVGTPYRWGGNTPGKGLDCSGLVKYAFNDVADIDLPRTSSAMAQSQHGETVERKDLKPGDLVFFNIKSRRINHVAIYLGNDRFVHAPRRGKKVTVDTLKKPYWNSHYKVAKRVLPKQQKGQVNLAQR